MALTELRHTLKNLLRVWFEQATRWGSSLSYPDFDGSRDRTFLKRRWG